MARVRLTNNSLNSYGTRVLTAGIDTSNFDKNPVLLYMHNRGTVIGIVKNIERNDDEITAELEFDEATELSRQCKKQFEFGSLRMVSIGIDVLEMSDAPELIVPGQRYATVTKSQLYEVSLVDIGANHDAVVLRYNGNTLNLADGGNLPLMALNTKINMENCIETKMLCEKLGLAEGSSNEAILEKIESLKADGLRLCIRNYRTNWKGSKKNTACRMGRLRVLFVMMLFIRNHRFSRQANRKNGQVQN